MTDAPSSDEPGPDGPGPDVMVSSITAGDPPGLPLLHDREYRVRAFLREAVEPGAPRHLVLLGAVRDQKPPGLLVAHDPDPLTIHHMQVELEVEFPSLRISGAALRFLDHPETLCTDIVGHYDGLVGLSIARGFTHKVRELFGGPRGCTHVTAMLLAMAPVAVQCFWSVAAVDRGPDRAMAADQDGPLPPDLLEEILRPNLNTCHVWEDPGAHAAEVRANGAFELPLTIRRRQASMTSTPDGG